MRVDVRVLWEPRDLWVGLYWKTVPVQTDDGPKTLAVVFYLCVLPCVPIRVTWWKQVAIRFTGETEAPR